MQNKPNLVRRRRIANVYHTRAYENKSNWTLGQNKPNSNPKTNPISKILKMNVNIYYTKVYNNKTDIRRITNKPNQTQSNPIGLLSSVVRLLSSVIRPLFPDKAGFSFDFVARPLIINANIRQLHRPMRSEQFEQFKARKETYHVY